jgi:hypothetical protein
LTKKTKTFEQARRVKLVLVDKQNS